MWHSNPLAGSPPPKRLHLPALQQQQQTASADGATTVRSMAAPEPEAEAGQQPLAAQPSAHELGAADTAPAGSGAPAEDALSHHGATALQADDDGWRWVGSGAASSPSLRGPRSAGASQGSPAEGQQARLEQSAASEGGSSGGVDGGVASLSQRWDLPSPLGAGNS